MARHSHSEVHPAYLIIVALLFVASLISCLLFFIDKTKSYQESLQKISALSEEKDLLSSKVEKSENERIILVNQVKQLEGKIKEISSEQGNFTSKLDSLAKENQELISQLKGLTQEKLVLENKVKELPSDTFLADLVKQKAALELQLSQLKDSLQNTQPLLQDVSSAGASVDTRLDEIVQAKVKMEEALKAERQLTDNLSGQILQERKERMLAKAEKDELEQKLSKTKELQDGLQVQLSRLGSDLEIAKKEKESLNSQLALLNQSVNNRAKELEAMNSALDQIPPAAHSPTAVLLPPVVVRADQKIEWLPRKLQGEVISIDRDNNFVIVNLGEADGISQGQIFKITRQDKNIAEVKVIQIRKTISACDINKLETGFNVEKDDQAVLAP